LLLVKSEQTNMIIAHYTNQGRFFAASINAARKEVFTFYGLIFVRQQIIVILELVCVLMLLLMLAIFSRVYLAHSLSKHAS